MTVRETLLPAAMVPGLVTVEDKEGNQRNVYPIDAKELIYSGDFTLVENGAIEAARMAATPLRSGMAAGIPSDQIVAEVSGIEGRVTMMSDPKEAKKIRESAVGADAKSDTDGEKAPKSAVAQDRSAAQASADQPKTDAEKRAAAPAGSNSEKSGGADNKTGGEKSGSDKK